MLDTQTAPEYRAEIDTFVAERAALFEVQLPSPWEALLSEPDHPRLLSDDLYVAAVALRAAERLEAAPCESLEDAVDDARAAVGPMRHHHHDRRRLLRRVRGLLLRAQMKAVVLPDDVPSALANRVCALQAHWEAITGALESFAKNLDAIARDHGAGLALSAAGARERLAEVNAAAYADLRRAFIEHYSVGTTPLVIQDEDIQTLVLESDDASVGLFSPIRAFTLLHYHFAGAAPDLVHQQSADAFVDAFCLRSNTEPRTMRGRVVLELRAWIDSFDKTNFRKVRYAHESRTRIEKGLRALANLWLHLRGAGDVGRAEAELQACLRVLAAADWTPGPSLKPSMLGVELRCFQGRIDCLIPEAFAAEINGFVTMHSRLMQERCN